MNVIARALVGYCRFLEPVRDTHIGRVVWSRWKPHSFDLHRRRAQNLTSLFEQHHVRYVFDIGAHVGSMTALYASLGSQVLCIEPDPSNVRRLRHRFRWTPGVTIDPVGAGRKHDQGTLNCYPAYRAYDTFSDKRARLLADDAGPPVGQPLQPQEKLSVRLVTLDQLIEKHGLPDYAKIDVEGFEAEVLAGLSQPVRLVSFECNLPEFEAETLECIAHLSRLHTGYTYNFWPVDHTFELMSPRWLAPDEIIQIVRSRKHRFMEIIAVVQG